MKVEVLIFVAALCGGALAQNTIALYGQCGGISYHGATACDADLMCACQSEYYSQCRPTGYVFSDRQSSCDGVTSASGASTSNSTTGTASSSSASSSEPGDDECANDEDDVPTTSASTAAIVPASSSVPVASSSSSSAALVVEGSSPVRKGAASIGVAQASSSVPAAASSSSPATAATENEPASREVAAPKEAAQVQGSENGIQLDNAQQGTSGQSGTQQDSAQQSSTNQASSAVPVSSAPPAASSSPATSDTSSTSDNSASVGINKGACTPFTGSKAGYAHTTFYYDGTVGACGCGGSSGMFPWSASPGGTNVYTAAGSQQLYGDGDMCGGGCGKCFTLTNTGYEAGPELGSCTGAGDTMTVMMTNRCPQEHNEQWCSSPDQYGFDGNFDIMSHDRPEGWDNAVVKYEEIACPADLSTEYQQCSCAGKSRVMRSLMQEMGAMGFSKA